ncbi:MAG: hypothetical protein QF793_01030, partial [Candidatus Peribacteraceae bacterium]|nr:hypothetical protein [Candidatus Peribacteraceae bacterium]
MSSVANTIFNKAAKADASDVHIAVGSPIVFRVNGELEHQGKQKNTAAKVDSFIKSVLGAAQYKKFKEEKELDVKEHVDALIAGENDLSEEFKQKASTIFEAAIRAECTEIA